MLRNILGIIMLLIGVWGLIYTIKNGSNMPNAVFGVPQKKYEVINKEKFNYIMIKQSYALAIYFIFIGTTAILTNNSILISLLGMTPLINLAFRIKAKKYVEMI